MNTLKPIGVLDLVEKWKARQEEHARLGSIVNMELVCAEVLADLSALSTAGDHDVVSPAVAAAATGYHVESIHRLIRAGRLKNYGSQRKPLVRVAECPTKVRSRNDTIDARDADATVAQENSMGALSSPTVVALDVLASRRRSQQTRRA